MARTARWSETRADGVLTFELSAWKYFDDLVNQRLLTFPGYIWRGQANSDWKLESTLDRALREHGRRNDERARQKHLARFQRAVQGRRGPNPRVLDSEDEWWALGQHYGLATPLLDWTRSPFVGAYFAFAQKDNQGSARRAVFALQHELVADKCDELARANGGVPTEDCRAIFPLSDENARLVSQGGLFTRVPPGQHLEAWVSQHFGGEKKGILIRISIPNRDRLECLLALNRMNINHLSLFPDLYGSGRFCNHALAIEGYA